MPVMPTLGLFHSLAPFRSHKQAVPKPTAARLSSPKSCGRYDGGASAWVSGGGSWRAELAEPARGPGYRSSGVAGAPRFAEAPGPLHSVSRFELELFSRTGG